uniref:Uncharacterized protein n=1 Tax=Cajanus cajan TaxID=3821 RepID=A0A151QN02_CAJCA|nr:hypothetical protein KK1_047869 [Cajanus cajan]
MMEACHLVDMGSSGYKYTWYRGHTHTRTAKKLDRALCDDSSHLLFLEAYVENLHCAYSDHSPLLLRCGSLLEPKGYRPFRFQVVWTTHKHYSNVVSIAWSKGSPRVAESLKNVMDDSIYFTK